MFASKPRSRLYSIMINTLLYYNFILLYYMLLYYISFCYDRTKEKEQGFGQRLGLGGVQRGNLMPEFMYLKIVLGILL